MSLIPHSPFGGGMSATWNSKLGTGKSLSGLGRARKILSLVLPTLLLYAHTFHKRTVRTSSKLSY